MLAGISPSYVIDTSAIGDLEGISLPTAYNVNPAQREQIWNGLLQLIKDGRLVSVYAAQDEFKRRCPAAYERVRSVEFFLPDTVALLIEVQNVLAESPHWAKELSYAKPSRDPADPYIVALACIEGRTVVTTEKHKRDRTYNNKRGDRIPDVCDRLGVLWLYLPDFIEKEKLL